MNIRFSKSAGQELERIAAYLSEHAPEYKDHVLSEIDKLIMSLQTYANRGKPIAIVKERTVRERYVLSYRIIYYSEMETVYILSVEHQRQRRKRPRIPNE